MAVGMEVIGALGGAAHGAYTIGVLPAGERVRSRAYMYSALNVGFTLGSLIGGIALAFHSRGGRSARRGLARSEQRAGARATGGPTH